MPKQDAQRQRDRLTANRFDSENATTDSRIKNSSVILRISASAGGHNVGTRNAWTSLHLPEGAGAGET
jgi:hypothetical protein